MQCRLEWHARAEGSPVVQAGAVATVPSLVRWGPSCPDGAGGLPIVGAAKFDLPGRSLLDVSATSPLIVAAVVVLLIFVDIVVADSG